MFRPHMSRQKPPTAPRASLANRNQNQPPRLRIKHKSRIRHPPLFTPDPRLIHLRHPVMVPRPPGIPPQMTPIATKSNQPNHPQILPPPQPTLGARPLTGAAGHLNLPTADLVPAASIGGGHCRQWGSSPSRSPPPQPPPLGGGYPQPPPPTTPPLQPPHATHHQPPHRPTRRTRPTANHPTTPTTSSDPPPTTPPLQPPHATHRQPPP